MVFHPGMESSINGGGFRPNTNYYNQWILLVGLATRRIGRPSKSTNFNRK